MRMNEERIMEILNNYEGIMRKTGAFLLEVEDNQLIITDSCEGVDMVPLNKEMCLKLSELFRELSETFA